MNRRGFIGALIAALALFRPRPICVECGSRDHVTSMCPINNAAMGPGNPPTYTIRFATSDGRIISGPYPVTQWDKLARVIWTSGPCAEVSVGDVIVVQPDRADGLMVDMPHYYYASGDQKFMGLRRA